MAFIRQSSAIPFDTDKISVSAWVFTDIGTGQVPILHFGEDFTDGDSGWTNNKSELFIGPGGISFKVVGRHFDVGRPDFASVGSLQGTLQGGVNYVEGHWNHVCCSVDVSGETSATTSYDAIGNVTSITATACNVGTAAINDVDCSPSAVGLNGYHNGVPNGGTITAPGAFAPASGLFSSGNASAGLLPNFSDPFGGVPSVNQILPTPGTLDISVDAGSWQIAVNDGELGIPVRSDGTGDNYVPYRLAEMHIWFGTFIDFSDVTNRRKFVGSDGRPVYDISVARSAFGQQSYYFSRNKKQGRLFQTNLGNAGTMQVVGTNPADFSPGP
jgi:hypothetical protein